MILNYEECISKYGSFYQIKKAIQNGTLFKVEKGIYSDKRTFKELEVIVKKYPRAVFTSRSAFYYHGITDVIPEEYHLATDRDDTKMKDERIVQVFLPTELVTLGKTTITVNGTAIPIYDKERMLIEAVRCKDKLPFDYYKEIIEYYRNHKMDMDIWKIQEYTDRFPKANKIDEIIQMEVF